jgi:hypothetical protein
MILKEKDIEDIIYNSPWLMDERFVIPTIRGKENQPGRQVNIGGIRINRYIDLLFKDTRDNRPVIVELKRDGLVRENIAQILEYKALIISMDDDTKTEWQREFGKNYYCPKLILVGTNASEEVRLSANLAGIEIRTLVGEENLEVDFNEINEINKRLNEWNKFLKSGNRTIDDRAEWVKEIGDLIKEIVDDFDDDKVSTKKLYEVSSKNGWVESVVFPFVNISIYYEDRPLCGLYEYFDESLVFSSEHIYFDFLVEKIRDLGDGNEELTNQLEEKATKMLKSKGYDVIVINEGMATIKISRRILEDIVKFKETLSKLIRSAIALNNDIDKIYS